jgi:hypothetical protein
MKPTTWRFLSTTFFIACPILASAADPSRCGVCTPPTNQPTVLQLQATSATDVSGQFTAAVAGAVRADNYLVVEMPDATVPAPVNGTQYNVGTPLGNGQVAYYGNATNFTMGLLSPQTKYTFYVFSVAGATFCYNTTAPLSGDVPTSKAGTPPPSTDNSTTSKLQPLLNFNFAGSKNTWTNLTPIVYYGWSLEGAVTNHNKKLFGQTFQIGPYVGTTISIKDSTSYLPALMLPGNAGIEINYFLTFGDETKFSVVVSPVSASLKVVSGFTDTSISIIQHNLRHGLAIRYGDYFTLSAQYTYGWHNLTTQSEENYKKVFPNMPSMMSYWNITLNTRLSDNVLGSSTKTPIYFTITLRSLVNPGKFGNLPNSRFITVGLLTDLNLKSGANPGFTPKAPSF